MGAMLRPMLLVSAAGKVVAALLWTRGGMPYGAAAFFFVPDFVILYHLFVPSAQGVCRVFTRFATDRPEIWLTIDDGPDEDDTPRILDVLDRHQARATFFVIGERAARFPELVREILRRGHDIGNHTYTHPSGTFWCAGPARVRAELDNGLEALKRAGVTNPGWFRPPVGIKNLFLGRALAERQLACVGWTVRSRDSLARNPGAVVDRVMKQVRAGSIVLMHEGPRLDPRVRVRAMELLLQALADRGVACVRPHVEQLR
jgi:peptidoglycan/xylan/chitin deacetylase (PgdA/CDA1 family)